MSVVVRIGVDVEGDDPEDVWRREADERKGVELSGRRSRDEEDGVGRGKERARGEERRGEWGRRREGSWRRDIL